ncbi:hypothetical protein ABB37_09282 [Leptomonas pyrrhocoris]|uniref:Uncharacterized protein n=1 Tax=Leptomonas pyrrhocoris TaxID=157538 RepID=A0A0M9FR05_LEPPY|nr:hypothetical protein ABB37_09282 [Leptomonas pyrrhocoris]KPA74285.1 hypothetical protein ABB37_09282 [Leptomonas pyrrhocoris]|eukprot:XP_015652724.1 hypothetical protein ABB37_09282 [Leptomonas pyrrhocoris]
MRSPKSSPASSPASSAHSTASPDTQPASPANATLNERQRRLAREQQQMIEQLISAGLAQVADLVQFGFTEAEINAAGLSFPSPHLRAEAEEQEQEQEERARAEQAATAALHTDDRRAKARKRGWHDEPNTPTSTPATARAAALSHGDLTDVRTTAKAVDGALPPSTVCHSPATAPSSFSSPPKAVALSEQLRASAVRSAGVVDQHRQQRQATGHDTRGCLAEECARTLRYEAEDEDGESACATAPVVVAAAQPTRVAGNTALAFSGLDVAVAKEIAQMLQAPVDDAAQAEQHRMQAYLESREDGGTPYM